jgi:hypothetical protein
MNFKELNEIIVGIDFDGTCVTHEYPEVGDEIGATPILKSMVKLGYKLILFTMRSGKELEDAVEWFEEREIPLYGINENPPQKTWTDSPKAHCRIYIDDSGIGTPLVFVPGLRPYVDWSKTFELLKTTDGGVLWNYFKYNN